MSDAGELGDLARDRSRVYWFLSDFYTTRPDAGYLSDLAGRLSALGNGAGEPSGEGFDLLKGVLDDPDHAGLAERLAVEYTRLFRGVSDAYGPPPPYESVHRGSHPMGEVTVSVVGRYAAAGFGDIDETLGPQDHIGAELKFMSLLCHEETEAWERQDREAVARIWRHQREFMDDHVLRWVPAYCRLIQEESAEPFYVGAALLTERAVADDDGVLDDLLATAAAR